jgi:hypothetical protein
MDLSKLEKRIRALEALSSRLRLVKSSGLRLGQAGDYDKGAMLQELESIAREILVIKEDAYASGDHRLALACAREFCRLVELIAKLRGDLDGEGPTNILHVHLDPDTAKKIAETYLARRRRLETNEPTGQ